MFKFLDKKRRRKGQSTLEYAVLIIIIIGALLTIQVYIKRGIQGRLRSATDDIGDQFTPGNTNYYTETTTTGRTNEVSQAGTTTSRLLNAEITTTTMNEFIINQQQEYWGTDTAP